MSIRLTEPQLRRTLSGGMHLLDKQYPRPARRRGLAPTRSRIRPVPAWGRWLGLTAALCWPFAVFGQDAAPAEVRPENNPAGPSGMMADSPVTFPERGALPSGFPPDVTVERFEAEEDYAIFESPPRSLEQIAAIREAMAAGRFDPPENEWRHLERTRRLLEQGGQLHLLALGDSIVNDTMRSGWIALLREAYPQADIRATVFVRGGGGCHHYRENGRIRQYVLPRRPDLVLIGGISQRGNVEAIRDVVEQIREGLPECEFLFTSGVFGSVDPRDDEAMAAAGHSGTGDYGRGLAALADELDAAYLDMTTPWMQYIRSSGVHPHLFYRDRVHANAKGEQILAKILMTWWVPEND